MCACLFVRVCVCVYLVLPLLHRLKLIGLNCTLVAQALVFFRQEKAD